eukprot:scaffold68654_cov69-Phaeocystis_antarctica.AAC.3
MWPMSAAWAQQSEVSSMLLSFTILFSMAKSPLRHACSAARGGQAKPPSVIAQSTMLRLPHQTAWLSSPSDIGHPLCTAKQKIAVCWCITASLNTVW